MNGRALGDAVEVVHGEGDVELARDGDEVKDGVGAAAGGADGGDGVLDGLAGEDLAGAQVALARSMTRRPASRQASCFVRRHGGDAGELHGRDAEELAGHGHGVGGELAAAGSGAGTGGGFEGFELGVVDLSGGVRAHAFEDLRMVISLVVPSGCLRWPGAMQPP